MRRAVLAGLVVTLQFGASVPARAQAGLGIRAARRDTIRATATFTGAFAVSNHRADSVEVMPHVETPKDWTVLMGGSVFPIKARETEMLMVSVVVPARAPAGIYPVRVWVTTKEDPTGVMDSIVVLVPQRRALEIALLDRPGFVVSGRNYDAGFLVRNRGNLATQVRLGVRSSLSSAALSDTVVTLAAEESRVVKARVRTPFGLQAATDDVLEISAAQLGDTAAPTEASARVTVVPEPSRKIEEYLKVPVRANFRATTSDGVSPFEIIGQGLVRDGSAVRTEFVLRGPTGKFSSFGERDEYRLQLTAPNWRVRAGDHFFMLSPLTGGAQPGFGVGAEGTRGPLAAGAFGQKFRRSQEKGSEAGAFVSARPIPDARVGLNMVERAGGLLRGQLASATAALARESYSADVEFARSSGASGSGLARSARVSAASSAYSLDLGHIFADTTFAGAQRGAQHNYFTASSHHIDFLSLGANGSRHSSDLSRSTGVPYVERLDVGSVSATLLDRYTLELQSVTRGTTISAVTQQGRQRGARLRGDQDVPFGLLSLEAEAGRATDVMSATRDFTHFSLGARRTLGRGGLSMWVERYSGGSITKGADGSSTVGGDATMRANRTTDVTLMGYATRLRSANAQWYSQIDARVSHALANGTSVTLRARVIGGGSLRAADQSVAYLEYGMPLRLPVSRLRTRGRVYGRVVDAATGTGVPGALVRLGPQVGITDREGQVAFGGVPGGEHRLSMSQETSFANAVFVGDPTLMVDSTRAQPTTFRLAIARSARLDIAVRRFATRQTGIAGAPDSLADAGALANATLVLAGERDTLYRTTSENGSVSFTDIPPGAWVVSIRGDAPAYHRFDPDRLEIALAPGETKALAFRLVPRRREIQLIGDGQELRSTAADPKTQSTPTGVKTVKPNEKHDKQDKQDR